MQRALSVLDDFDLHELNDINPHPYDHPFFGQFFLAGVSHSDDGLVSLSGSLLVQL
jgi:hypothetical protein